MRVQYVCIANPTDNNDMPTESKEKPKDDRVRVTIHPSIAKKIEDGLPEHQKGRPFSFVVDDLLGEYLKSRVDSSDTLRRPPGSYSYSSNNSLEGLESVRGRETFLTPVSENFVCHDPEKHDAFLKEQKKLAQKDSPAFKVFWETYQAAGKKVLSQSKTKARTAWKEAIKSEKPEQLIEAAKRCVIEQNRKIGQDEWVSDLPDAYRWLRDGKYSVFLEAHTPTQPERIIPGVTVL
jgi:hypothetical protein